MMEHPPEPYELQYKPDLQLPTDIYLNPIAAIEQEIGALHYYSEHAVISVPSGEHRASLILATLHLTGQSLEDYGLSSADLDDLVRHDFQRAAQARIEQARLLTVSIGVYPLKEEVSELLWKGGAPAEAIGYSDKQIDELDREVNIARAQQTIVALREAASEATTPLSFQDTEKRIQKLEELLIESCTRLGTEVEELGVSTEEYDQFRATPPPPTGWQALKQWIKP
jgi:hypothetical protein